MKKLLKTIFSAVIVFLLIIPDIAFAINPPTIDPVKSPVDATKQIIKGQTDPNARITVTGGMYEISPVMADAKGKFEITVSLVQESTNQFHFTAEKNKEISGSVTVTIIESRTLAEEEASKGIDVIAPDAPTIDTTPPVVDVKTYTLTGSTESGNKIIITGDDETNGYADSNGKFTIKIQLKQNQKNTFKVTSMDASENISPSTLVSIEEKSTDDTSENKSEIPNSFPDINGHWAEEYIETLRENGIISGYADGTFGPNNPLKRAELTKIALKAFNIDTAPNAENTFTDIEETAWYKEYVATAYQKGFLEGYEDGTFRPNNEINRAEALKILFEASQILSQPGIEAKLPDNFEEIFPDVKKDMWFFEYVQTSYSLDIVSGYEDGTFGPGNSITRAEIAKITVKLMDLQKELLSTPSI